MTQAGAKGPAAPAKPAASPAAKGASPAAPAVAPKPAAGPVHGAVAPRAAATVPVAPGSAPGAPRKGPPPLPPESGPDLGAARPAEPMRPRFETSPGVGTSADGHAPRAPLPATLSREEVETMIKRAVADAVVTVLGEAQRLMHQLERRIDELERRPAAAPVAPAPPMVVQAAAQAAQPAPAAPYMGLPVARTQVTQYGQVSAIPVTQGSLAPSIPHAPLLDVHAIERDVKIDMDLALDGRKRKRNLVIVVVLFIVVVFGGMFALLADSYAPHH